MSEIINLSPKMKKRLGFSHELLDQADRLRKEANFCKGRDELVMGHLWMVKDMVSRFRAHWPETRRFTEDMVSVGLEALVEYFDSNDFDHNKLNAFLLGRTRDFINDNRSTFAASFRTNQRREQASEPLEYNFASKLIEEITGEDDFHCAYVDILDAIESLSEVEGEELNTLILHFLRTNHKIDESSLSDEEKEAIDKISRIVRSL